MNRQELREFFIRVHVNRLTGCWIWNGTRSTGYGMLDGEGAHVISYRSFVAPIPDGLDIDHLCMNRLCVNPAHLDVCTRSENLLRHHRTVTHCKRGHERTPENVGLMKTAQGVARYCLVCRKELQKTAQKAARDNSAIIRQRIAKWSRL